MLEAALAVLEELGWHAVDMLVKKMSKHFNLDLRLHSLETKDLYRAKEDLYLLQMPDKWTPTGPVNLGRVGTRDYHQFSLPITQEKK